MQLVLFMPEIASNAGAATRIAACFSASLHIVEPCGFPIDGRKFRRAAMDYGLLAPPQLHVSWVAFQNHRRSNPGRLVLLTTKSAHSIWEFQFDPTDYLIIGQESAGVPSDIADTADQRLRIPIQKQTRSLNMATAAAVGLAEASRQFGLGTAQVSD